MPSHRVAGLVGFASAALLASGCGGGGAPSLHDRLLAVGDLPAGWSVAVTNGKAPTLRDAPCISGLSSPKGLTYAAAAFVEGTSIPNVGEVVATGAQAAQTFRRFDRALARCRTATLVLGTTKARTTVRRLDLPRVGRSSSAYAWRFTLAGIRIGFDLVLFRAGDHEGYLTYADLGTPRSSAVTAFARAAAAKAATGSTDPIPDTVSIASAPVRTARTALGTVAYRTVGSGPPLLLITGYGGAMESWDRRFVDALALRHRVVIFDNAGIGRTSRLPAPLGVDAMANQTAALIDALGLRRPDVLGWSMGSMVAQALAVLHPSDVRRLVLCAAFPGDGTTARPSRAELDAFESGDPQKVMAALFPSGQTAAKNAYLAAASSYPAVLPPASDVLAAQRHAVDEWWAGRDPAGRRSAAIRVPTLVADGTVDRLDPVRNSRALAALIPGARLELYPGAGHAFLFQRADEVVRLVESFLG